MKKYLLPNGIPYYKANLHSHSTFSDGCRTPAEMKEDYKARGYQILAFSDHDALHSHNDLTDESFLALTAYEISIRSDDDPTPHAFRKVVDLNLLADTPDACVQVGYHPESVQWLIDRGKMTQAEVDAIRYAGDLRDMHYYPANINKIIRSANENGFLVTINHPAWSLTNFSDYGTYEGAWAVEIYNHGCRALGGLYDSEQVYDEILRSGKRLYAVATDDNHGTRDRFGGYIMIASPTLSYPDVIAALRTGKFYASCGPEITELSYENGEVTLRCSPAQEICMTTLGRRGACVYDPADKLITEAHFRIDPELCGFVRFRVTDARGKNAWTNAYDVDSFMPEARARRVIL